MEIGDLTESYIKRIADSQSIHGRGKGYYKSRRVTAIQKKGKKIYAVVVGSSPYKVELSFGKDQDLKYKCSCPYWGDGCKHVVAVLYELLNNKNIKNSKKKKGEWYPFNQVGFKEKFDDEKDDSIIKSFDLVDNNLVSIESHDSELAVFNVKDGHDYKVEIEADEYFHGEIDFEGSCSCEKSTYNNCEHILACYLFLLKKLKPKEIPKDFIKDIKNRINQEKYNSFIKHLDSLKIQESPEKKYGLIFSVQKNRGISIITEKAQLLKNGDFGSRRPITSRFAKDNYQTFSENEKKVFDFLFNLDDNEYYYSRNNYRKDSFKTRRDTAFLHHLREIYRDSPEKFTNFEMPNEKAHLEFSFLAENKGSYKLKLLTKFNGKTLEINESNILGEDSLWLNIRDKSKETDVLVEIDAVHQPVIRKLIGSSDMEIPEYLLDAFIEERYLQLSDIGNVKLPKEKEISELENILPKPRIFLKDYEGSFCIELRFLYKNREIIFNKDHDVVIRDENGRLLRIRRNKNEEERFLSYLLEYSNLNRDIFLPKENPLEWLSDITPELISRGFEIYGLDSLVNHKIRNEKPVLDIKVSSGIDWFDLKAEAYIGDEKIEFEKIVSAFENHERFIKLSDGTIGVIPKKWMSRLVGVIGFLEKDKETLKASKTQIKIIEELLDIADRKKTDQKFKEMQDKFKSFNGIKPVDLPKGFNGELREYQKYGYYWLHFLKEFSFGGCLADEMGLGKTIQTLALLLSEKEMGIQIPSLIIVPTSLVFNWENEIKKFAPSLKIYIHHGQERLKNRKDINKNNKNIILTTYGTIRNDIDLFKNKEFNYIILDESQQIKNPFTQIARNIYKLNGKNKLVLTGTPVENNYLELWSQFSFLNPGLLGTMDYFKNNFMKKMEKDKKEEKCNALRNIVHPFLLMRKKETVSKELPEKQITTLYCEMDDKQRKIYDSWKEKIKTEIKESIREKGFMKSRFKVLQGLTRLRQICNHPKLIDESFTGTSGKFTALIDQIEEVIQAGHKVLIFSSFVKMLRVFKDYFEERGINFAYLDGQTRNRKEVVEEFQGNDNIPIFLISLKAGGLGLNLTSADYVFIVDPWWNPAVEMQAIDRTHRIGQDKKVFVYKAITKDSVEEKILELQESKRELIQKVIFTEEGIFKELTPESLNSLFG